MRYLAHTPEIRSEMLQVIGATSVEDLFQDVPSSAREVDLFQLPTHQDELTIDRYFQALAAQTLSPAQVPSFVGGGLYSHHIPATVDALIQRGEFLTSYTPYQAEIAQGTLQYLFEFQTQVALLFGMEVANASLYDGATATVEAVLMANRVTRRTRCLLSGTLHPHYREAIQTYGRFGHFQVEAPPLNLKDTEDLIGSLDDTLSCVVVQYPDVLGQVQDFRALATACEARGILLVVVVTEVVSLGLLMPPGEMGAHVVVGEGQSVGNGPTFGGPTVGLFATRKAYVRQMPGRLVGQTVDQDGKRGWVLTLSTREQHIRREKATSNICTNAGLCALAFTIHLTLLGAEGLRRLAQLNHHRAQFLYKALKGVPGVEILNKTFFNEFVIRLPEAAEPVVEALARENLLAGIPLTRLYPSQTGVANLMLVAATEMTSETHCLRFADLLNNHLLRGPLLNAPLLNEVLS